MPTQPLEPIFYRQYCALWQACKEHFLALGRTPTSHEVTCTVAQDLAALGLRPPTQLEISAEYAGARASPSAPALRTLHALLASSFPQPPA